jgi:hypothetical protein
MLCAVKPTVTTRYRAATALGLAILLGGPSATQATDLACLHHVSTHHFAHRSVRIPSARQQAFRDALQTYARERGLHLAGSWSGDRLWNVFLQSPGFGVEMSIGGDGSSDHVALKVESNCSVPPEPWRPYWSGFNAFVDTWRSAHR